MDLFDKDLQELVFRGRTQGYLTYDEVNAYLPDEEVDAYKLDNLLIALDEQGIDLVTEPPEGEFYDIRLDESADNGPGSHRGIRLDDLAAEAEGVTPPPPADVVKWSSDPIRLYLGQMAEIPLLTREKEIALAKKIEVTRKRFRRTVLGCAMAMRMTIGTLDKVHKGTLPFDRTIKVSLTERLTKPLIQARMPLNLPVLHHLAEGNRCDFARLINRRTTPEQRAELRKTFLRRRRKMLILAEELSLRTRRIQTVMRQIEDAGARMLDLRQRLEHMVVNPATFHKRINLRRELRTLMVATQESPASLKRR
ncbi:MAG: RNA polymerase sigma factor region1.1 domain-containing protein, partial [Patescibacteria group bacterium]|nr:RNA polymerase sigma factor region1.1 domain-containing protein [Patescibacteria group bacterium]